MHAHDSNFNIGNQRQQQMALKNHAIQTVDFRGQNVGSLYAENVGISSFRFGRETGSNLSRDSTPFQA